MKCYEFYEVYYKCVYTVADMYEYSSKFMEQKPYGDCELREAQGMVWYALRYIFGVDLKWILKYCNTNNFKIYKYCNIILKSKDLYLKHNLKELQNKLKNDT